MARLSKSSRMIGIILLLCLAGIALFVTITWTQFSTITTAGANQFLKAYRTQITALSITPQELLRGRVGAITLDVDGTIITIEQLQVSLKEDLPWWPFSMARTLSLASIKSVAVDNIDIRLSPKLFKLGALPAPEVEDKKPAELTKTELTKAELARTLASLPLIAVGRAQIHLADLQDKHTSLVLNYLNLDQRGYLLGRLSVNEQKLIDIQASLGKDTWQGKTRLELRPLYALATHLSELNQDNAAADKFNHIRQIVTGHRLHFAGHLDSAWEFHLQDNALNSTHKLHQLDLNLGRINQDSLSQPVVLGLKSIEFESKSLESKSLESKSLESMAQDKTAAVNQAQSPNLELSLSGPLSDLTLQLSPFTLETKLSKTQIDELLDPLEPQYWPLKTSFRLTPQDKPRVTLTLNKPLDYRLTKQTLNLPLGRMQISLAEHHLIAELNDLTLTPKVLSARWRLDASVLIPLCLQLASKTQQAITSGRCDPQLKQRDSLARKALSGISLNGIALSLSGELDLQGEPLLTGSELTSNMSIDAQSRVTLLSPGYRQQKLALSAEQIELMLQAPLTLENVKQLHFGQSRLTVKGNRLALTASQPQAAAQSQEQPHSPVRISSQQTLLQLSGGSLSWHKDSLTAEGANEGESHAQSAAQQDAKQKTALQLMLALEPFSVITDKPQLTDGARELSAQQLKMQSKANFNVAVGQDLKFSLPGIQLVIKQAELIESIDATSNAQTTQAAQTAPREKSPQNQPKPSKRITQIAAFNLTSQAPEPLSHSTDSRLYTLQTPLKSTLQYRLQDLQSREQYQLLGKQRSRKRLEIREFSLEQSLIWQAENRAKNYLLSTKDNWQLQDISFTSEHNLTMPIAKTQNGDRLLKLQGKFKLTSDINQLLRELEQILDLNLPLVGVGDIQLSATHKANWTDKGISINASLTPEVEFIQGELNQLPFEQTSFTGACDFTAMLQTQNQNQSQSQSRQAQFTCERLLFKIAAFNPGVLLTDIEAVSRLEFAIEQLANDDSELNTNTERNVDTNLNGPLDRQTASLTLTADASTLGGKLLLPKFNLHLTRPSEAYLILQGLDLTQLLAVQPLTGVYADGIFDGVLPVELENGRVSVTRGYLAARAPGGLVRVDDNPAVMQMRQTQPYLDYAFSILEELHYSELASEFDMAPNGDAKLRVMVKGRAKGIERPIHFNYTQEENMLQLLKSLQIGDSLQNKIEQAMEQ